MSHLNAHDVATRPRLELLFLFPVLVVLVLIDLAFIGFSVVHELGHGVDVLDPSPWLLGTDGGHSEIWGYVQQATLVLLLVALTVRSRRGIWAAWAALFLLALADDQQRLHERKGAWLAEKLSFPEGVLGLRANDLGEIAVWGLLALVPLAAVVLFHLRSDRRTRRASLGMAVLVAAYVFFGGVVDQLHVLVLGGPLESAMGTIEDGGELVVLSVSVAYVLAVLQRLRRERRSASWAEEPPVPRSAAAPSRQPSGV